MCTYNCNWISVWNECARCLEPGPSSKLYRMNVGRLFAFQRPLADSVHSRCKSATRSIAHEMYASSVYKHWVDHSLFRLSYFSIHSTLTEHTLGWSSFAFVFKTTNKWSNSVGMWTRPHRLPVVNESEHVTWWCSCISRNTHTSQSVQIDTNNIK